LKNFNCEIKAGEKIGICGRTGSGKSTLVSTFFRLIELNSGKITIGGADISKIGLSKLRNGIVMIPQNPVLFKGTIRSNIDETASDDNIWDALEKVNLKSFVSQLSDKLDSPVEVGGSNLSFGQRQLMLMARAVILKPKVLVMDEATASLDQESDDLMQKTLKSYFSETTVLSIAHRLTSISNYDKIMVLDEGRLVELDTPEKLLADASSHFAQLVKHSGIERQ